jgi:trehalose 6-phosphate phosphatase
VGNHGFEILEKGRQEIAQGAGEYRAKIAAALQELSPLLAIPGVAFEYKGLTASLHYRRCPSQEEAREAILEAVAQVPATHGLRVTEGKMAVDLRPPLEVNKGSAVLSLVERYSLRGAFYLGDDRTDADAFRVLRSSSRESSFEGVSVVVIGEETPDEVIEEGDFGLRGVADVRRFLKWLEDAVDRPGA